MRKIAALAFWLLLAPTIAFAQSSPGLVYGQVPTAAQWNSYFAAKQNVLGYTPVNKAGDVMQGKLITATPSSSIAGFNLPPGTSPITPINGDLWTTSGGIFAQINGVTFSLGAGAGSGIDVWLVVGDSNSTGQGNSAQSPVPAANLALMYCVTGGTVTALTDPACSAVNAAQNANTGSAWPATAIAYGRRIGFILTGVSGSTQASACDFLVGNGNWQSTAGGSNFANALAALNAGLAAYSATSTPTFRGIIVVLGGDDAVQINNSVCTQAQYTTGYTTMAANWRSATIGGTTYPHLPIFQVQTGTIQGGNDTGFAQVRAAQVANAAADGNTLLVNVDLASYAARNLLQTGTQHPFQSGYNQLGTQLGGSLLPFVQQNIPYLLLNANAASAPFPTTATGSPVLQVVQADSIANPVSVYAFGASNAVTLYSALGTAASPTQITSGSILGAFAMKGYGSTGYPTTNQGTFTCYATQNFVTGTAMGTQCGIYTTPNGSATPVQSIGLYNGSSVVLGPLDAASPTAQTLSFQNVLTGTSNTAGAAATIAGSRGTGTGAGGNVQVQVALAGTTGSTQNALVPEITVLGSNGFAGFGTETNPQFPWVFSTNATTGAGTGTGWSLTAFGGPWTIAPAATVVGWNTLSVATLGTNNFIRVDNTVASPSNLSAGEQIGAINYGGWGNGGTQGGRAQIIGTTLENWTTTFGTGLQFNTTAAGGSRGQAMYVKGGVIIGTGATDPGVGNLGFSNMLLSGTAPTISAGFCTSPSISQNNGTGAFEITVGSACAAGTGTVGLPAAAHNWKCEFVDVTTNASHAISQTGGTTTTATVQDYSRTTGAAQNMVSGDVIRAHCAAY